MRDFVITTDNTTDLPHDYYEKNHIEYLYLSYTLDGKNYKKNAEMDPKEFYQRMRQGSMPTTSQANAEETMDTWRPILDSGKDILHLAFSSGLSGSCNSAKIAAEELGESYPDRKIIVVDSLCASLGEGLFVDYAVEMKKAGKDMEEIAGWLEAHKLNFCHVFLIKLVDMMEERIGDWRDKQTKIFISHGDCLADAEYVKQLVQERFGYQDFLINIIGATIGTHSGPGTVALFFLGDHR